MIAAGLATESPRAQDSPQPFSISLAEWNRTLDATEKELKEAKVARSEVDEASQTLTDIEREAIAVKEAAAKQKAEVEKQLDALGKPPVEGEPPEPGDVAKKRNKLNADLNVYKSRIALADVTLARTKTLLEQLAQRRRSRLVEEVTARGPLPYDPDALVRAATDIPKVLAAIGQTATDWWDSLPKERRASRIFMVLGVLLAVGLGLAWTVRRLVLSRLGPHPTDEQPAYTRRLLAAVADGLAKGIVPAAILLVVILRIRSEDALLYGPLGELIGVAAGLLIVYILATALPHSALNPEEPTWRLTRIPPAIGERLLFHIHIIAILFCVDDFFFQAANRVPDISAAMTAELRSVWTFLFNGAQGFFVLSVLRPSLWRVEAAPLEVPPTGETAAPEAPAEERADEDETADVITPRMEGHGLFWNLLRLVMGVVAIAGMAAPVFGYINLGNYLMNNLLVSAVVIGLLYILRGLFREAIGVVTSSAFLRDRIGAPHKTRTRLKFFLRTLMDLVLIPLGAVAVAPGWGVSESDLLRWVGIVFGDFTVGNVSISISDIVMAVIVFLVVLALTSATKRTLGEKVLPETQIEDGLQHSITAGVGYVGFVLAAAIAVMVAGVDLTNIALIAGALSVGIGFGLQNIVNNFVSGLILLIERPIKVGDWVVVGPNEGFVKTINMRATEIETWQRASVIVPNADLLSSALKNWTHKDKYGRVDVPISVALDSDPDKVERILVEIGRSHPRVVRWPQPVAYLMKVDEDRLVYELRIFTADIFWVLLIGHELRTEIVKRFRREGIVIPYSQRVVHLVQGDPGALNPSEAPEGESR